MSVKSPFSATPILQIWTSTHFKVSHFNSIKTQWCGQNCLRFADENYEVNTHTCTHTRTHTYTQSSCQRRGGLCCPHVSPNSTMAPESEGTDAAQADSLQDLRPFPIKEKPVPGICAAQYSGFCKISSYHKQFWAYFINSSPRTTVRDILNRKKAFVTCGK